MHNWTGTRSGQQEIQTIQPYLFFFSSAHFSLCCDFFFCSVLFCSFQLIILALLLGSDYTSGVRGIGPAKAVKLVRVLDECCDRFIRTRCGALNSHVDQHPTLQLFKAICAAHTPHAAVRLLLECHSKIPVSSNPPAASIYSATNLSDLSFEMNKPLSSTGAMIAKLKYLTANAPAAQLFPAWDE